MTSPIRSPAYSLQLEGNPVFLSGSFPSRDRPAVYFESANSFEITDAVVAAARAVFGAGGRLVFGGHPTITPLILSVANDYKTVPSPEGLKLVHIYQSRFFEGEEPKEVRLFEREGIGEIHWIEKSDNIGRSLMLMRRQMLRTRPVACILIGGMEGVYAPGSDISEFALFRELCSGRPAYPIAGTGGAARLLWKAMMREEEPISWVYARLELHELSDRVYPALMERIVEDIASQI